MIYDNALRLSFDLPAEPRTEIIVVDGDFSSSEVFVATMALRAHCRWTFLLTTISFVSLRQRVASELALGSIHGRLVLTEEEKRTRQNLSSRSFVDQQGINSHGGNGIDMVWATLSPLNALLLHLYLLEGVMMTTYMGPGAGSEAIRQAHLFRQCLNIPWVFVLAELQFLPKVIDNLRVYYGFWPDGSLGNTCKLQ